MIIPGRIAVSHKVITGVISATQQTQPCGVDLTLKRVMTWSSAGVIDFDNTQRRTAQTVDIPFEPPQNRVEIAANSQSAQQQAEKISKGGPYVDLTCGSYLVEFNEGVDMPLDLMGQILVRSSLFRSGALVHAGVMDSGYRGAVGAMLQVVNPHGLRLYKNAKLAQMVFQQMSEPVESYSGVYQGRMSV